MSLMVLRVFRHLPGGSGSSPSEFARNFRLLAGTFALFGRFPHSPVPALERLAEQALDGLMRLARSQSEIVPSRAASPPPPAMRSAPP
jgi:hypothetical protein